MSGIGPEHRPLHPKRKRIVSPCYHSSGAFAVHFTELAVFFFDRKTNRANGKNTDVVLWDLFARTFF